jgi:hypothetical protein
MFATPPQCLRDKKFSGCWLVCHHSRQLKEKISKLSVIANPHPQDF